MNFKNLFVLIFLISCVGLGFCQVPSSGVCPSNVKSVDKFNVSEYLGKWYEYSKYPFFFEIGGRCIYAIYGNGRLNGTISVLNSQINSLNGKRSAVKGTATVTDEPGKLLVSFSSTPNFVGKANYWVLGTDYKNFSVVYSCGEFLGGTFHTTVVWILTREREPSLETVEAANKIIDDNNIPKTFMMQTNQVNCPKD